MAKSIAKSIRISDEVYGYIEKYRGNNFNEKFENIILDYQQKEKDVQARIKARQKELELWEKQASRSADLVRTMERMRYRASDCLKYLEQMTVELKEKANVLQK